MSVDITDAAKHRISEICQQNPNKVVRLAILSGGCNGFTKNWEITETVDQTDSVFIAGNSKLVIDQISLEFLNNVIIDYKQDMVGSHFTVEIPSATSSCGCGTSFSI